MGQDQRMDHYANPRRIMPRSAAVIRPSVELIRAKHAEDAIAIIRGSYPGCKIVGLAEAKRTFWFVRFTNTNSKK